LPLKTDLGKGIGLGTATHHQDEGVVGDVGHQDEEGQAETESGAVEGVGHQRATLFIPNSEGTKQPVSLQKPQRAPGNTTRNAVIRLGKPQYLF